jgi:hypothetical protein
MKHYTPLFEHGPPIQLWRGLYHTAEESLKRKRLSKRQHSEAMLRTLCFYCNTLVRAGLCKRVSSDGEALTIYFMAAVDTDEFIQAVHEAFPDDHYPVDRLNPFLWANGHA